MENDRKTYCCICPTLKNSVNSYMKQKTKSITLSKSDICILQSAQRLLFCGYTFLGTNTQGNTTAAQTRRLSVSMFPAHGGEQPVPPKVHLFVPPPQCIMPFATNSVTSSGVLVVGIDVDKEFGCFFSKLHGLLTDSSQI